MATVPTGWLTTPSEQPSATILAGLWTTIQPSPPAASSPSDGTPVFGAPVFSAIHLSAAETPRYARLEITFDLKTIAQSPQFPYDPAPPPGVPAGQGVSVEAHFSPDGGLTIYRQPAFIQQEFLHEIRSDREWTYPTGKQFWKVRFSPPLTGEWQVRLAAQDAGGFSETETLTFHVGPSANQGFIRVSRADPRYFEYEDGGYFPALGYNLNYDAVKWTNPILDNEDNFRVMGENGIRLVRLWLSQWSIYGSAWNPWNSLDPALHGQYIPYSGLSFKDPFPGEDGAPASETSLRLDASGNPCMALGFMKPAPAVKPNTSYRVRVRYRSEGLRGPRRPGAPYGLIAKTGGWLWGDGIGCGEAGTGQPVTPLEPGRLCRAGPCWKASSQPDRAISCPCFIWRWKTQPMGLSLSITFGSKKISAAAGMGRIYYPNHGCHITCTLTRSPRMHSIASWSWPSATAFICA